jgi:hypothetical protein
MPTDTPTDWVALLPVILDDAAKQCLQTIAQHGEYIVDEARPEEAR